MSALKHGFFRREFMLCDRCAWNGYCERFRAGGTCGIEEEAFHRVVGELTREYGLDGVADRLLAERAAMYLIRLTRVEAYEAAVGVTEETVLLGRYIERLDRMLLRFLEALAVTRDRRKDLEGRDALEVGVTELLEGLERRSRRTRPRRIRVTVEGRRRWAEVSPWNVYTEILEDWLSDVEELEAEGGEGSHGS